LSERKRTFAETGIARAGFRNTIMGVTWAGMWAIARKDLGREPNFYEVCAWWAMSKQQGFRYQQAFRRCWPALKSPWDMTRIAIEQGVTSERKLWLELKAWRVLKGVGMSVEQRDALADRYAKIVGLAVAA
jgi:hypothetical protein